MAKEEAQFPCLQKMIANLGWAQRRLRGAKPMQELVVLGYADLYFFASAATRS